MNSVRALAAILGAVTLTAQPALANSQASAGFSVAATFTSTASVRVDDAGTSAPAVSARVSRSAGGATIVAVYAYAGVDGERRLVLQPESLGANALVSEAHWDRAALSRATYAAGSDRIVVASAT